MIHFYHFEPRIRSIEKIGIFSYENSERMLDYVIRPDTTKDKINAFYSVEDSTENEVKFYFVSNEPFQEDEKEADGFNTDDFRLTI